MLLFICYGPPHNLNPALHRPKVFWIDRKNKDNSIILSEKVGWEQRMSSLPRLVIAVSASLMSLRGKWPKWFSDKKLDSHTRIFRSSRRFNRSLQKLRTLRADRVGRDWFIWHHHCDEHRQALISTNLIMLLIRGLLWPANHLLWPANHPNRGHWQELYKMHL